MLGVGREGRSFCAQCLAEGGVGRLTRLWRGGGLARGTKGGTGSWRREEKMSGEVTEGVRDADEKRNDISTAGYDTDKT